MPKSKRRVARAVVPVRQGPPPTAEQALSTATLALTQASLELVREAELRVQLAARAGEGVEEALRVHHNLRTASLALLVAYSDMEGLPDPRESAPGTE